MMVVMMVVVDDMELVGIAVRPSLSSESSSESSSQSMSETEPKVVHASHGVVNMPAWHTQVALCIHHCKCRENESYSHVLSNRNFIEKVIPVGMSVSSLCCYWRLAATAINGSVVSCRNVPALNFRSAAAPRCMLL
jgi:hypothetical protein